MWYGRIYVNFEIYAAMLKKFIQIIKHNKRELSNTIWLVSDKFVKYIILFVVNIFVIRYLGDEQYGYLTYALSFISLFASFSYLGIDQILLREILRNEIQSSKLITNAIIVKIFASFFIALFIVFVMMYRVDNREIIMITLFGSIGLIFQSFEHISTWYQAKVLSKYVVIAGLISSIFSSIVKLLLIYFEFSVVYFSTLTILEASISAIFLMYFYKRLNNQSIFSFKQIEISTMKNLIANGWPFMLAIAVNYWLIRIDHIMIGDIAGFNELGVYSAAVKINEMFYVLPGLILISFAPKIYKIIESGDYKNNKNIALYIRTMLFIGIFIWIFFYLFGEYLFVTFYGQEFRKGAVFLNLLNIGLIIVLWSSLRPIFIRAKDLKYYNLIGMILGTIINIGLNYILIPKYGAIGACYATIVSLIMINFIFDIFYKPARGMVVMQIKIL